MATRTLAQADSARASLIGRAYRKYEAFVLGGLGLLIPIVLWEIAARAKWINPLIFSSPSAIGRAFRTEITNGVLAADVAITLRAFAVSFLLAAAVGIALGLVMGLYTDIQYILEPYVWFFYTAPGIAFYSLLVVWFGFGFGTVVAIAFWLTVIPIAVNTLAGVRSVDSRLVQVVRAFGGRTADVTLKVVLPSAVPMVVAGLRIGLGRALVGVIVGELFSSNAGVGYRISFYAGKLQMANMFVPLVCVVVFGVALSQVVRWAEERLTRRWALPPG